MELDRPSWFFFGGAALFFAIAIVILIGEFAGWWNDRGEVGLTIGTVAALAFIAFGVLWNASRSQLATVARAVNANGVKLDVTNQKLGKLDKLDVIQVELDEQTGVLGRQLRVLNAIRDRL